MREMSRKLPWWAWAGAFLLVVQVIQDAAHAIASALGILLLLWAWAFGVGAIAVVTFAIIDAARGTAVLPRLVATIRTRVGR
jgi:FtsH-binding integral membrane protein